MSALRLLARPAMAGIYVIDGIDAVRHPKERAKAAAPVPPSFVTALHLPEDPVKLVQLTGAVHVVAGTMLAFGRMPRVAAAALLATMVPTTLADHKFWEEHEPEARARQKTQFLKNLTMSGGLLLAIADTGGRPSVSWWAKRAARRAAATTAATAGAATGAATSAFGAIESFASEAIDAAGEAIAHAGAAAEGAAESLRGGSSGPLKDAAGTVKEAAGSLLDTAGSALGTAGGVIGSTGAAIASSDRLHDAADTLKGAAGSARSSARTSAGAARGSAKEVLGRVPDHLRAH